MRRYCQTLLCLGLSLLWLGSANAVHSAARRAAPDPGPNPLVPQFQDPEWVRRFLNYEPALEPRLSTEEQVLYRSLEERRLFTEDPLRAATELEGKITPASSALLSYTAATLFLHENQTGKAIQHYRVALEKHDRFLRAHKNLGIVLAREGRFDEAVPHLTRTVALGGADGLTYGLLGYTLLSQENFLSAEIAYRQATLLDPDNLDWRLGLIKCFVALENLAVAVDLLDELISRYPDRETLWALQANVLIQLDQPQRAIVNLEAIRRLGKANASNLALLGDLYLSRGSPEPALAAYLAALEQETETSPTRTLRAAELLTRRGAWTEAQALLKTLQQTHAATLVDDDRLRILKLEARAALASGAGERAIQTLEQITTRNPLDGEALLLAGDYYAQNHQPEKAEFRYHTAAQIEGFQVDAWVKLAQLRVQSRKYPEAVELLRRAQRARPQDHIQRYLEKVELAAERAVRS
jgi:tetratricopeptide (TPR) repeat protein